MLTYAEIKAIENALGEDKAAPIIQALEATYTDVLKKYRQAATTSSPFNASCHGITPPMDHALTPLASSHTTHPSDSLALLRWVAGSFLLQGLITALIFNLL